MKNKQTKALSLSLSANPIRLIKDTFFAITKISVKFFDKIQIVGNNTQKKQNRQMAQKSRLRHQSFFDVNKVN